jgi:hypothetical protein
MQVKTKPRRTIMTRIFVSLAVVVGLAASAFFTSARSGFDFPNNSEVRFAEDGAFRDGLYLGKLAARSHRVQRPAIGRWSSDQDRASFAAGYRLGYEQNRILRGTNSTVAESAE